MYMSLKFKFANRFLIEFSLMSIEQKQKSAKRIQKKSNGLTTLIGGIIDKLSYGKIATYIALVLTLSATYFFLANPYGHGTNQKELSWLDSLYYCIITFSSLGYGDITPLGFGKFVASLQVISGLALTAIFVGKIASERQYAMLRLVYTSEHQRRIVEFENEINFLCEKLDIALEEHNHENLYKSSKNIYSFIASINNYLHFQSSQADLASFGNTSALKRLYQSIAQLQVTVYDAIRTFGVQDGTKNKLEQIVSRINNIADTMMPFHTKDVRIIPLLNEIKQLKENLTNWNIRFKNGQPEYKFRSNISDYLLEKVCEKIPAEPWPKNTHKTIAYELGVQIKLVQRCIDKLKNEGRI